MDIWPGTVSPSDCPRSVTNGGLPGRSATSARKQAEAHPEGTNAVLKDVTCGHNTLRASQETFCFTLVSCLTKRFELTYPHPLGPFHCLSTTEED